MKAIELLFDGNRGQYIPKNFVEECLLSKFDGLPGDVEELRKGPDVEGYWDIWSSVLDNAEYREGGHVWRLHQDGDVWLVCDELMTGKEYYEFYGERRNCNVLEGIACPKCDSEGPFDITALALFLAVTDDGTLEYESVEWGDDSYCRCCECGHEGTIWTFTLED